MKERSASIALLRHPWMWPHISHSIPLQAYIYRTKERNLVRIRAWLTDICRCKIYDSYKYWQGRALAVSKQFMSKFRLTCCSGSMPSKELSWVELRIFDLANKLRYINRTYSFGSVSRIGSCVYIFHKALISLKAENVANALMYLNQLDQLYSNQIRPR